MILTRLVVILIFLTYAVQAMAEYRVYQYYVSSRYKRPDQQKPYLVTSTLNPVAYIAYHGGPESIKVDLLRTWPCPGFTGQAKPLCPAPLEVFENQDREVQQ